MSYIMTLSYIINIQEPLLTRASAWRLGQMCCVKLNIVISSAVSVFNGRVFIIAAIGQTECVPVINGVTDSKTLRKCV